MKTIGKFSLVLFFSLMLCNAKAQDTLINKLSASICDCISTHETMNDSEAVSYCFLNAAKESQDAFPQSDTAIQLIFMKVEVNLETTCPKFLDITLRLAKSTDWVRVDGNPPSMLDSTDCRQLLSYKKLCYLEGNGDTTRLTIKNGYWTDDIEDGKYYSKCTFKWTSATDFEVTYITSTDPVRSLTQKPGDKFYYHLINKTATYYDLVAHYGNVYVKFKIYYSDK
jgi:hypothetical protein